MSAAAAAHFFFFKVSGVSPNFDDLGYSVGAVDYYRILETKDVPELLNALKNQKYCLFPNIILSLVFYFTAKNWMIYKMVNLLYYFIMIYAVYFIASKLRDKSAGLLASFMVSTMPLAVALSRLNYPYYQVTAISLLILVFLIKSEFFLYGKYSVFFGLFSGIALLTHHLALLYLAVIILSVIACGKINRLRIINLLISLCVMSPFIFFIFTPVFSTYARESTVTSSNIIKYLFLGKCFSEPFGFNAVSYAAMHVSYLYAGLMVVFTRPVRSYLSSWLFTLLFIFGAMFLFRSVGLGLDVGGTNFFIIFPLAAILFSNSFVLFFKERKNCVLKAIDIIILMLIITNGALYVFPNEADNGLLNKKNLPHKYMIMASGNNDKTSTFLESASSALLADTGNGTNSEILLSCNRWHPGIDALIFHFFLEHGLYVRALIEEDPTRENHIRVESGMSGPVVNGYRLAEKTRCGPATVFYFFKRELRH
jgi:hypothetical protein